MSAGLDERPEDRRSSGGSGGDPVPYLLRFVCDMGDEFGWVPREVSFLTGPQKDRERRGIQGSEEVEGRKS